MSPFPAGLVDRWHDRQDNQPGEGTLYWHILLGGVPEVRAAAGRAQGLLSEFTSLHMTPLDWLHITTLVAGPAGDITPSAAAAMLTAARSRLASVPPIDITLSRVLYHPEAIALGAEPRDALTPVLNAAAAATAAVTGKHGNMQKCVDSWMPHMTLCYSTARQPAAPVISALGKHVPPTDVRVDTLSLIVQRGPERLWDWHQIGHAPLRGHGPPHRDTSL